MIAAIYNGTDNIIYGHRFERVTLHLLLNVVLMLVQRLRRWPSIVSPPSFFSVNGEMG